MKMKKLITILCVSTMVITFSSCSNKESVNSSITSDVSSSYTEITQKEEDSSSSDESNVSHTVSGYIEEQNALVVKDVEDTISALNMEYEQLKSDINTYDKYLVNVGMVDAFYGKINKVNSNLCLRMCQHSLDYAELIIKSDKDNDSKYDELDELYESIYDDAGDDIYDKIYDGILDDLYDDFYEGILDDAYKTAPYDEWSKVHSNEYDLWSNTRSDVYDDWSDYRSDVYDFWSDLRSAVYKDDIEKAEEKIADFRDDIEKLKQKSAQTESNTSLVKSEEKDISEKSSDLNDEKTSAEDTDVIRPEFKAALDSYESFFDEYCDFMKKYNEMSDDLSLLTDYADYMKKYTETMQKMSDLNSEDLSDAELKYYIKVTSRINEKLLDATI